MAGKIRSYLGVTDYRESAGTGDGATVAPPGVPARGVGMSTGEVPRTVVEHTLASMRAEGVDAGALVERLRARFPLPCKGGG